jgi:hypothetical protein
MLTTEEKMGQVDITPRMIVLMMAMMMIHFIQLIPVLGYSQRR